MVRLLEKVPGDGGAGYAGAYYESVDLGGESWGAVEGGDGAGGVLPGADGGVWDGEGDGVVGLHFGG